MSNTLDDSVGGAHLYDGLNYQFTSDRFDIPNSAIYFNKGYLTVPPGIYFSGDFSITAWINLKSNIRSSRIIDFANGSNNNNILFAFNNNQLFGKIFINYNSDILQQLVCPFKLELNTWYHVAYVLIESTAFIYKNGIQVVTGPHTSSPLNITRTMSFI